MTSIIIGEIKDDVISGYRIEVEGLAVLWSVLAAAKDVVGADAKIVSTVLVLRPGTAPHYKEPAPQVSPPPSPPIIRKIPTRKPRRRGSNAGRLSSYQLVLKHLPATIEELTRVFLEEGFKPRPTAENPRRTPTTLYSALWWLQKQETIVRDGNLYTLADPDVPWSDSLEQLRITRQRYYQRHKQHNGVAL